jgi:hypothetical protein
MLRIKKRYIVNEQNKPVGVVLDLDTFQKIEELLEDRGLAKALKEVEGEKPLPLAEARKRYARLKKRR